MALDIIFNAKTQRIGVCNACESTLVHRKIAKEFLPLMKKRLDEKNVEIRADEDARSIVPEFTAATEEDWGKEYLDYILSCHGNQNEYLYPRQREFKEFLEKKIQKHGGIAITKEAGVFICRK